MAMGGYTTIDDHPSLFLYAVLDKQLGGPSFFFVVLPFFPSRPFPFLFVPPTPPQGFEGALCSVLVCVLIVVFLCSAVRVCSLSKYNVVLP